MLDAIHYTEAREKLDEIMTAVCKNSDAVVVTRTNNPPAVIMSLAKYNSLLETLEILSDNDTVRQLARSVEDLRHGRVVEVENLDEVFE